MPLSASKLRRAHRAAEVAWEGETIHLVYDPTRYGLGQMFELGGAFNDKEWAAAEGRILATVADMLIEWDVIGDDGQMWPITVANLRTLDSDLQLAIWSAIRPEGNRPRTSGPTSPDTSPSTVGTNGGSAPGGTTLSSPPGISDAPPGSSMTEIRPLSGVSGL